MRTVSAVSAIAVLLVFILVMPVPTLARDPDPPGDPGPSCGFPTGECCSDEVCVAPGLCRSPSGTCYNCPCIAGECPAQCPTAAPALSWPLLGALIVLLAGGGFYLVRPQRQQT